MILGIKKSKIRKAYFSGKLKDILNEIQCHEELTDEKLKELEEYLKSLKTEETKFAEKLKETFGGEFVEDKKMPSVEEISSGGDTNIKEWKEKEQKAEIWLNSMYENIKQIQGEKNVANNFWLDFSTNLIMVQSTLDKIRVFYDQQYRSRLIRFKEDYDISRAEAEEYAKLTSEYRDYKNSILMRDRIEQLVINARRHEDRTNYK